MTVKSTYHIVGENQQREVTFKGVKSFDINALWIKLDRFVNPKHRENKLSVDDVRFYVIGERGRPKKTADKDNEVDVFKTTQTTAKKSMMYEAKLAHFGRYMSCKEIDALPEADRRKWQAFYQNYRYNSAEKHDECLQYRKDWYDKHSDELRAKARAKYAKNKKAD